MKRASFAWCGLFVLGAGGAAGGAGCGGDDDMAPPIDATPDASMAAEAGTPCEDTAAGCASSCVPSNGGVEICDDGDNDCNGLIDDGIDLSADPAHCGACYAACTGIDHTRPTCRDGSCVRGSECESGYFDGDGDAQNGCESSCLADCYIPGADITCLPVCSGTCKPGYTDRDGDLALGPAGNGCEHQCVPSNGGVEICDGVDNDCNGLVDDAIADAPSAEATCGALAASPDPFCQPHSSGNPDGVQVVCRAGVWACELAASAVNGRGERYCAVPGHPEAAPNCALAGAELACDGKDDNCDGVVDETFVNRARLGQSCASDDGVDSHGACRTVGVYVCTEDASTTRCSAEKANCADLPGGCTELCDGIDNDCDGSIDEPYTAKGANAVHFVQPPVVRINTQTWITQYEVSRPTATASSAGAGNGWVTQAPPGVVPARVHACSKPGAIPWSNVAPHEAEESCARVGGRLCRSSEWERTCAVNNTGGVPSQNNDCSWGYATAGCKTPSDAGKQCNLAAFDTDDQVPGNQDAVLATASPRLSQCAAVWDGRNGVTPQRAYDITGNLAEISVCQLDRAVCSTTGNTAECQVNCCSGTSTAAAASRRLCGAITGARRLSGQACTTAADCCNSDGVCNGDGQCIGGFCAPLGQLVCRARGESCQTSAQCCDAVCAQGRCGGSTARAHTVYPVRGGSYLSEEEMAVRCVDDGVRVGGLVKRPDLGFRCCFDQNPTL